MLHEPPKRYVENLQHRLGDRSLRVVWDRKRHCFQVQRPCPPLTRKKGWIKVIDIGPKLRAGAPLDLGCGDGLIEELLKRDRHRQYDSFDRWYRKEFEEHDRDIERKDKDEDEQDTVELVHEVDDTLAMRHHVAPTSGPVQSFKKAAT